MIEPITIGIDEIREMRRLIYLKEHAPETLQILDLAISQAETIKAQGEEIERLLAWDAKFPKGTIYGAGESKQMRNRTECNH